MTSLDLIHRLHQHRMWVTRQLLAAVEPLTTDQLTRSFTIGQGSVWRTLVHLYAADWVWLEALQGNEFPVLPGDDPHQLPGNQAGEGGLTSLPELAKNWRELDARWDRYLSQLQHDQLPETVSKISTSSGAGQRFVTQRADILLHLCTHAQYTVAQLMNMLRQLNVQRLPDVMLISLARQESVQPS